MLEAHGEAEVFAQTNLPETMMNLIHHGAEIYALAKLFQA
jgi:hypothetical protein